MFLCRSRLLGTPLILPGYARVGLDSRRHAGVTWCHSSEAEAKPSSARLHSSTQKCHQHVLELKLSATYILAKSRISNTVSVAFFNACKSEVTDVLLPVHLVTPTAVNGTSNRSVRSATAQYSATDRALLFRSSAQCSYCKQG